MPQHTCAEQHTKGLEQVALDWEADMATLVAGQHEAAAAASAASASSPKGTGKNAEYGAKPRTKATQPSGWMEKMACLLTVFERSYPESAADPDLQRLIQEYSSDPAMKASMKRHAIKYPDYP